MSIQTLWLSAQSDCRMLAETIAMPGGNSLRLRVGECADALSMVMRMAIAAGHGMKDIPSCANDAIAVVANRSFASGEYGKMEMLLNPYIVKR